MFLPPQSRFARQLPPSGGAKSRFFDSLCSLFVIINKRNLLKTREFFLYTGEKL